MLQPLTATAVALVPGQTVRTMPDQSETLARAARRLMAEVRRYALDTPDPDHNLASAANCAALVVDWFHHETRRREWCAS